MKNQKKHIKIRGIIALLFYSAFMGLLGCSSDSSLTALPSGDLPEITFNSVSPITEGASDTIVFHISEVLAEPIDITYSTQNGTATAASDYSSAASLVVTIPAGQQDSPSISVAPIDDSVYEGTSDESFQLNFSVDPAKAQFLATESSTDSLTISIIENDSEPTVQFSAATSAAAENTSPQTVAVTLTGNASEVPITVDYEDAGAGTATSGSDYTAITPGTLTFATGETSKNISIVVADGSVYEGNETINLEISNPTDATLGAQSTHTHTITENESVPTLQFSAATSAALENSTPHTVAVTLSGVADMTITVDYADAGTGTATSGSDFTAIAAGTLTFLAGDTSKNISITVADDSGDPIYEGDETINLAISNPTIATLGAQSTHEHTITENEAKPSLNFSAATDTVFENILNGTKTITVTASGKASANMTVDYANAGTGTATSGGTDFTLAGGTATITAGNTSTTFNLTITYDYDYDGDETIIMSLANPSSNAQLGGTTSETVTIVQPIIAAGGTGTTTPTGCIILRDKTVKCWGDTYSSTPVAVASLTGAESIFNYNIATSGDGSYVSVLADGSAKWWGHGAAPSAASLGLTDVKQFVSGETGCWDGGAWYPWDESSAYLKTDGTVYGLVAGALAQFGGSNLTGVKQITAQGTSSESSARTWMVLSDGTVKKWAQGAANATTVAGLSSIRKVSAGTDGTACALKSDGTVLCSQANAAFSAKAGITTAIDMTVGNYTNWWECTGSGTDYYYHAGNICAVLQDGTVQCWSNSSLGNYSSTLTTITGLSDIIGVSYGVQQKFIAIKSDHTVWEWDAGATSATQKTGF